MDYLKEASSELLMRPMFRRAHASSTQGLLMKSRTVVQIRLLRSHALSFKHTMMLRKASYSHSLPQSNAAANACSLPSPPYYTATTYIYETSPRPMYNRQQH